MSAGGGWLSRYRGETSLGSRGRRAVRCYREETPVGSDGHANTHGSREVALVIEGVFHQSMGAFELQFLADIGALSLDGARADEQLGSDLFARLVLREQFQYTDRVSSARVFAYQPKGISTKRLRQGSIFGLVTACQYGARLRTA